MKDISTLAVDEIQALSEGEEVVSISKRSLDFAAVYFENTVLMAHADGGMSVSFLTTMQADVGFKLSVAGTNEDGVSFAMRGPSVRPVLMELAQARGTLSNFADLAAGILEHLLTREPSLVVDRKERIEAVLKGAVR